MSVENFIVPFWEKDYSSDPVWWRNKYIRKGFRIFKFVLFSFSGLMIIWSFMQSLAAPYTNYHQNPGHGLEFGYHPFKNGTGDPRFDLGSWSIAGPGYHAFYSPATVYGPFLSWFVYPVAKAFAGMIYAFSKSPFLNDSGLGVLFAMLIILTIMRFINFWPTLRAAFYSEKQMAHQAAIDAINSKYSRYDPNDKKAKLQKHQEINDYNKKHHLKPFAILENFFITTPIFLIIFKVITITRPVKFTTLFGLWSLSATPSKMIFYHMADEERGWLYLILCLIIIPVNFFSQNVSSMLSKIRNPQLKNRYEDKNSQTYKITKMQRIMSILFLLFTFFWSTSLAIYYFFNAIFTIFQSLIIHCILMNQKQKTNMAKQKLQKLGLNV